VNEQDNLVERFTRIETKMDIIITGHAATLDDHEARLRAHDDRINAAQSKASNAVTPTFLWLGFAGAVAVASGLSTIWDKLVH